MLSISEGSSFSFILSSMSAICNRKRNEVCVFYGFGDLSSGVS